MARPPPVSDDISTRPTTFEVGAHTVVVSKVMERRWTVTVDGRAVEGSFATQADAWEAGVREADRADGIRS